MDEVENAGLSALSCWVCYENVLLDNTVVRKDDPPENLLSMIYISEHLGNSGHIPTSLFLFLVRKVYHSAVQPVYVHLILFLHILYIQLGSAAGVDRSLFSGVYS